MTLCILLSVYFFVIYWFNLLKQKLILIVVSVHQLEQSVVLGESQCPWL